MDNQGEATPGAYRVVLLGTGSAAASGSEDGGTPGVQTHTRISYYYFGSQRVAMRQGVVGQAGVVYWLHADPLGSLSEATTGASGLAARQRYWPYGQVRYLWGSLPTTYNFTGQRLDASTGLLYYGARYYDPTLARFLQADTIVPEPGNPQSLNRYAYVLNNPLRYTDPTGHCAEIDDRCWEVAAELWRFYGVGIGGTWTLAEIKILLETVIDIALEFGNHDLALGQKLFREVFGGRTTFVRRDSDALPFFQPGRALTSIDGNIYLPNGWTNDDHDWAKFVLAHELGHKWNLSEGMVRAVGGRPAGMTGPYDPGPEDPFRFPWETRKTAYAATNPSEDWAQTFAAWIYNRQDLGNLRRDYVQRQVSLLVNLLPPEHPPTPAPQPVPSPPRPIPRGTPQP